jgi:secreted PhoX family phosphatase
MACFEQPDGTWVLLRNHELMLDAADGAYPEGQPTLAYDRTCHGGVSRLVLDPKDLRVLSSNMVLTGTLRNCAGGPTPQGWITCEEAIEPGHGYAFFCSSQASSLENPSIIKSYGRFRHEAVAFDTQTKIAYLTEDEGDGCLYRFTPDKKELPFGSGRLEAMAISGQPRFATGTALSPGQSRAVEWVSVPDPFASKIPTRHQAQQQGAALVTRGEGAWMDGDGIVFSSTTGGKAGLGQILRLSIADTSLTLVAEAKSQEDFNGPDNITVAPWGDFVVAEDTSGPAHIYGVNRKGECYPILRNRLSDGEIAGVCFSSDGQVMFCNLQWDGLTLAIRGPFGELFPELSES